MGYKIPRRQIWCDSIGSWLKEMAWVFIVYKIFGDYIEQMVGRPSMPVDGSFDKA